MRGRKILLPLLIVLFITPSAFCQTEVLKGVVNNLAFYKQKKDLKYLSNAKNTVDSLIKASADTLDLERNVYKAVVYSSILNVDSLNKTNQPANMLQQTADLVDRVDRNKKSYKFQAEIDYSKRCLTNTYIRKAFVFMNTSDFSSALPLLENAKKYTPSFQPVNAYIAYSNNKLGNLHAAAKYYESLAKSDSTNAVYAISASAIYKSFGDTVAALAIIKKARKILPNDRSLLLDEANIYTNKKEYRTLETLLPALLDINVNNADIAFVAANCYDHLNQYDKAESLYLRAIELNSSAFDPIFNLGLLYFKISKVRQDGNNMENEARAAQWLEKANEISPNNVGCLQVLKLVYAQEKNQNQINKVNNKLKQLTN